jgi:hypothetical protein
MDRSVPHVKVTTPQGAVAGEYLVNVAPGSMILS